MSTAISAQRLQDLNSGVASSTHLAECLAVDFSALLVAVVPLVAADTLQPLQQAADSGITRRMALAATALRQVGVGEPTRWQSHPSDTVRGWACYLIGSCAGASLAQKLEAMRALADDLHFGVREWAWLALRADIVADPLGALALLLPWTQEASPRLRRFACEAVRPRGVWASHINVFKQQPELAQPLLEALADDPNQYVQDSVGNWLNDAGKTSPGWVRALCAQWEQTLPGDANRYIRKRALRSLNRPGC